MAKGFFRELKHYKLHEIAKNIDESIEKTKSLVGILKKYGIVKAVKASKPEFEDLSNSDIVLTDVIENNYEIEYVFDFVGVVMVEDYVFKCYPKYIRSTDVPKEQLKQVLKVLKKYNDKEQLVHLFNGEDEDKLFNKLAVALYLLEDYYQNGLYTNQHEIIEANGDGEILWDKTINETFAFIQNNRPYYVDLQTQNLVDNEMDYVRRLHECILSECSRKLNEVGILELFDIAEVELTNSGLEDFGDEDYIKYRLENEIRQQFITRKQTLLKTLYTYISNARASEDDLNFSLYGTNSYNLVWEDVCKFNFKNCLDTKLSDLPLDLCAEYLQRGDERLIDIIDKPIWTRKEPFAFSDSDTLKPDLVSIYMMDGDKEYCFGIFDAKYYYIDFEQSRNGWKVIGKPGVGDVTKQYLYQLAYEEFAQKQGYKYMANMFLCPGEDAVTDYGFVSMQMLNALGISGLKNIHVVKLCAEDMYEKYISNKTIDNPAKYIPDVARKNTVEKRFTTRLEKYSQVFKKNRGNTSNEMQIIYPKMLHRNIGAKMVYDIFYPYIDNTFYSYKNDSGRKVAYDSLAVKREQLAETCIELESKLRDLSEIDIRDIDCINSVMTQCFECKDEIKEILKDEKKDTLLDKIVQFVNTAYL